MGKVNGEVANFDLLADGAGEIAINGVTTVYTECFYCQKNVTFGFEYKFRGAAVLCDIFIEQGSTPPAVEGAASANMVIPDSGGTLYTDLSDDLLHVMPFSPVVTDFLRIKIVGKAGNGADTVLEKFLVNTIVNA